MAKRRQGVYVPIDVWDWLMGCGDSFEPPATALKLRMGRDGTMEAGRYWWRSELRRRIDMAKAKRRVRHKSANLAPASTKGVQK